MHIVLLTDTERSGGATIAATRLAHALVKAGAKVTQIVHRVENAGHLWSVEAIGDEPFSLPRKLERKVLPEATSQQREDARASAALATQLARLKPDVVSAHNLHSAARFGWRWNLLETALQIAPVAWTLHDEWSFSGRCAYSYDCNLFRTGCDERCPTPNEYPSLSPSLIHPAWEGRRDFFEKHPHLVAVSPSQWLANEARSGLWRGHRVEVISNSVPLDVFRPQNRAIARDSLKLGEIAGSVALVSATDWNDRRKGAAVLQDALHEQWWKGEKPLLTLLTLGKGHFEVPAWVRTISLGHIDDEKTLAMAYAAADFLIHPAIADNLPNVVLESLACGTPVVALPVGGMSELAIEGRTGFLAHEATGADLAWAMRRMIQELQAPTNQLNISSRAFANERFAPGTQALRMQELFTQMVAEYQGGQ